MSTPRTRSSMALPRRGPHALLYPVTTSLGITGNKTQKRREVNARLRALLAIHSPFPSPSTVLPSNHQGHDLSGPLLNTSIEPGGYRQVCFGCSQAPCPPADRSARRKGAGHKPKIFFIRRGLPPHILKSGMLGRLARAKAEFQPVPRDTTAPVPAALSLPTAADRSLSASSVSASSSQLPPSFPPSPLSHAPTLEVEMPISPATTPQQRLNYYYGGYGGVHYSPDGHIVDRSANANTADDDSDIEILPALEYPSSDSDDEPENEPIPVITQEEDADKRPIDLTVPIALIAWHDNNADPMYMWAHPRVNNRDGPASSFRLGEVVLKDYLAAFIRENFPVQSHIERYLDGVDRWITVPWSTATIQIFGACNRTIYLRNPGITVAAPAHVLEL
ncbi:hypothetical protein B0H13DRAFT_2315686 [Mycena leptocephala]|nr:hypothetical protein B0H13DRAFT_2315686 [Mycena leptocephala]